MGATRKFCCFFSVRTGCLVIGWFDIVYGTAMTLLYLLSMYSGYFNVSGFYKYALWLDFVFTIVQLLGGIVLIHAVKNNATELVLFCAGIGCLLIGSDMAGDILLGLTFSYGSLEILIPVAILLFMFICVRCYMTFTVFSYYRDLKQSFKEHN